MPIGDYIIRLGLDGKQVATGANSAVGQLQRIGSAAQVTGASVAKASTTLGKFFSVATLGFLGLRQSRALVDFASQISDSSKALGISAERLQEWLYAASQAGAQLGDLQTSFKQTQKAIAAALGGNADAIDRFTRLGITLEQLKKATPEEVFMELAKAVRSATPSAQLMADLMGIMGRSADAMIPAFREGFGELANQARIAGIAIKNDVVDQLDVAGDKIGFLGAQMKAVFAPIVGWLAARFSEIVDAIRLIGVMMNPANAAKFFGALSGGASADEAFEGIYGKAFDRVLAPRFPKPEAQKAAAMPDADELALGEEKRRKLEELQKKNADRGFELQLKQASPRDRARLLAQRRAALDRQLAVERDPLRREELLAERLDLDAAAADRQGRGSRNAGSGSSGGKSADSLTRIGGFRGAGEAQVRLLQTQVSKLEQVVAELRSMNRKIEDDPDPYLR